MASGITRRRLLIGGGAGVGLIVAWAVWPRAYRPNLTAAPGESLFGAYLKIGRDGQVTVAVPQAEHGQGVYTALPQIVADELGADWRTVGVEAAPLSPLYANPLGAVVMFSDGAGRLPAGVREEQARRAALMLTGGSTSVRMFEAPLREAGAAARVLLCKAAAARWGVAWTDCDTADGFVVNGERKLRFADLAEAAASGEVPDDLPLRFGDDGRLTGESLPRLDAPAKLDGSANYAADVRLPDMVFASIRQGPTGDSRLLRVDKTAADRVRGVVAVVENPRWVAAVANTWWAAERALDALAPRFETRGPRIDDASIAAALDRALDGDGARIAGVGDLREVFAGQKVVTADYAVGLGVHAALEPPAATAYWHNDRLELWCATQAPGLVRTAAAAAIGVSGDAVTVHPMLIGGSFGQALEHDAAVQAAILAVKLKRPVQVQWSRGEAVRQDRFRPAAKARMTARLATNGAILGWQAKIAVASTGRELTARLMGAGSPMRIAGGLTGIGDATALAGAMPPYRLPAVAIDHHPAEAGVPAGWLRGGAHGYTAFFTECFIDELAHTAGTEAMSYRIGMLGGDARLARCLSTAAALGGWDGGVPGSGQGIACHAMAGSYIAVLAEAHVEGARIVVDRLVAAVDCGRQINPDLVRQQIEGGLIFGIASALGASTGFAANIADARTLVALALPRLADTPDIAIELIASGAEPGGVSDLGVAAVAPAIANAVRAATGMRLRNLPLRVG